MNEPKTIAAHNQQLTGNYESFPTSLVNQNFMQAMPQHVRCDCHECTQHRARQSQFGLLGSGQQQIPPRDMELARIEAKLDSIIKKLAELVGR